MRKSTELIMDYTFKSKRPYAHQVRALQRALDLDGVIALHMEPGTGKTRVAIDYIGIMHEQRAIQKVLCIVPNVAIGVWEDQIDEYLPSRIPRKVILLDDENTGPVWKRKLVVNKQSKKPEKLTFIIVNYDVMKSLGETLRKWRPDIVICDESHFIKNHTSLRSKAVHQLRKTAKRRMTLTGTPITNSPLDIYSQFIFLDDKIFGARKWTKFKKRYSKWGGFGGFKLIGYRRLDELAKLVHKRSFEATADELDLPPTTMQVIKVPMSDKTREVYSQMDKEFIAEIKDLGVKATAAIILTKMIRLNQITGGFVRIVPDDPSLPKEDVPVGREKLEALEDLLDIHCKSGGYKAVVFARFVWETRQIMDLCNKMGLDAILDKGIKEDRKRFQKDPKCKVYIVPLAKGGIAVNELVAANIGIFYSIDHSSDHITQALKRLDRPGQVKPVLFLFLTMKGTYDELMYRSYVGNKNVADEIIYSIGKR